MKRAPFSPGLFVLALGSFLSISAASTQAQDKPDAKYRSPRATVRTLLTAITVARANPQLIQDAVSCLDLPRGQTNGGLLATQLEAVLRARDVDTEALPDEVAEDVYVLPDDPAHRIALHRMPDGRWLFDGATVTALPKLYADAQKHLQDRNKEAAALNVSPDHASARAALRSFVTGYRRQDFDRVLRCMDLSDVPSVARQEVGRQAANKLRQILLRQPRIILQEVSDSNYSDPYTLLSQPEGVIELVRIPSGDRKGEWVFSRESVGSIDRLYAAFEDRPYSPEILALGTTAHLPHLLIEPELWLRSHLPAWLRSSLLTMPGLRLEVYELIGYVVVPLMAFGFHRLMTTLLTLFVQWLLHRRGLLLPRETIEKRMHPVGRFLGVVFLRWGLLLLEPDKVVLVPVLAVLNPLLWVLGMWAVFRLIDLASEGIETHLAGERRRPEITRMLWPVGSLAIKIALFVFTLLHLMAIFSWDMTAVLTGLGIGGLAFALGAQDSLKNLFGSFTLIADRPFVVGESVKIGNHEIGVVETVGLRSTRIRTADDTLLIVPNSSLTTLEITNYGRRRYRRYTTRIGVAYSTTRDQLKAFRDGIKEVIRGLERTRKDHFEVAINDLAASAIEILVNVYFEVANRHEELEARDALILEVLRLAEELHIDLAYPTQTIHLVPALDGLSNSPKGGVKAVDGEDPVAAGPLHG
jgi:MscS family membrane protein